MKRLLLALALLQGLQLSSQTPTYRWVSGSQEPRERSNLVLTEIGPRQGAASFTDADGNYWVFGGNGRDFIGNQGFFNDTWKYDKSAETWEWKSGQMSTDQPIPSYNNALSFDGVNDLIEVPSPPVDHTQDLTIEFWFKPAADGVMMSYSVEDEEAVDFEGWRFEIVSDGTEIWIVRGTFLVASFNTSDLFDEWHHFALTYQLGEGAFQSNALKVYIDGALLFENTDRIATEPTYDYHITYIGGYRDQFEDILFTGELDEVRFWSTAKNQGEIVSNKDIELSGNEEYLEAYYPFNQGVANFGGNMETELIDATGNQNAFLNDSFTRDGVFIGQMAAVRIWDSPLTTMEIIESANSSVTGVEAGLISAYDFNEGVPESDNTAVSSIADLTANGLDGTIENFELLGGTSNFVEDNLALVPVFYQNQDGGFSSVTGDLNGDTYEDIITTTYNSAISVLLNDQAGGLTINTEFSLGTVPRNLSVGHFNADSHLDVAVVGWNNGTDDVLRVYFGDGTGAFGSILDIDPGDNWRPELISSADFNGDLVDDLVIGSRDTHEILIYLADGMGDYNTPTTFDVEWLYSQSIALVDVNNDTFIDVVAGSIYDGNRGRLSVYTNDGVGNFTDESIENFAYVEDLHPVDLNQDGNVDFIFSNGGFSGLLIGNGDGSFDRTNETNLERDLESIRPFKFEGENLQYLAANRYQTNFFLYEVSLDAEYTLIKEFNTQSSPGTLHFLDFDKNGTEDILYSEESNRVNLMLRDNEDFNRSVPDNAIDFDGTDDYLDFQDLRPYDDSFTWEGWIKTEDNGPIFSFSSNNPFSEYNVGHFSLAIRDGRLTLLIFGENDIVANDQTILTDGDWHHIALSVTINGAGNETVVMHVDGAEVGYQGGYDFDAAIDFGNTGNSSKLGYTSGDFLGTLGPTGQAPESNWVDGVDFPGPVDGRAYSAYWTDPAGDFYVFGGQGENGVFNSIKKYDQVNNVWNTIKGIDQAGESGSYGTMNVSDPSNLPPPRYASEATIDSEGNVWIFGGESGESSRYNDLWKYDILLNEWVWVSGSSSLEQVPNHGTQGVSDPANVPGAREFPNIWSDADGNIWVFGGLGLDSNGEEGYLNDLWRFDLSTSEWTWIGGSDLINQGGEYGEMDQFDAANMPGSRAAGLQWIDGENRVWLFGGFGYDKFGLSAKYLNDLWSYNPTTNQWSWHSGSDFANSTGSYNQPGLSSVDYVPGARRYSTGWLDDEDNLWLFGGFLQNSITTGLYNDFWKYQPSTKEWTWISGVDGTALINELGSYGELGSGSLPHPGERHGGLVWTDPDGDFWVLGGASLGSSSFGFYNDLWHYEVQKNRWSYLGGSTSLIINEGSYGSKGIGSSTNEPRARWHGASWTGDDGKLWFFGGIHHNQETNGIGWINDLWFYDPDSDVYTWMGGDSDVGASGVYGAKGQASASHIPGARSSSAYWKDLEGNFWLFGGYESFEYNNDLWKFNPNTLEWTWVSGNNFQNTPGTYGELRVPSSENIIGARRYTDGRIDHEGNVWIFGGNGYDSQAQLAWLGDLWKYNTSDNTWTWMSGSSDANTPGNFGELGVPSESNMPPPRYAHASWIDDVGNVWIFGGFGLLGEGDDQASGQLNDLWKFDVTTNLWTWMGGSDTFNPTGEFGTQGVFSELNEIPGKARAQVFQTEDKSLWLLGGRQGGSTSFNDFWEIKFTPGETSVEAPSVLSQTGFQFSYDEPWATSFQVQVSLEDSFDAELYNELTSEKTSVVSNLEPGTIYYYRVNSRNEIGQSGFLSTQSLLTLPATPQFESLEVAISNLTSTTATINWLETSGILDGYNVDISTDETFEDPDQFLAGYENETIENVQTLEVSALTPGTRYFLRLRSVNASGTSEYSLTLNFLTTPEAPSYVAEEVISEITQNSAMLSWNPVPEILTGYRITISTDPTFADESQNLDDYVDLAIPKSKTSIEVRELTAGTRYYGQLTAFNNSGSSEPAETISILTLPESPVFEVDAAVSASQTSATIDWIAPNEIFDGYRLEVSLDFSFNNTNLMLEGYGRGGVPKEVDKTLLTDEIANLSPGTIYFARIRSYNASGESANSNIITIQTVPRAPNFNSPSNITQTAASLSWSATTGTETYLLDLNLAESFDASTSIFTEFPLAVPFQVLADLSPGVRYYARIQSSNASGSSGASSTPDYDTVTFITIPADPVLNVPDVIGQDNITVSWPDVEGAGGYEVDVSDNFFQTFLFGYNELLISESQINIEDLDPGSEYQIRVRSKNISGESSNAFSELLTLPATPIARDATNSSANVFTANWDPVEGADFYNLEVSTDDFQTFHFKEQLTSSNPIQMTDLEAGATYEYRVSAGNSSGESPFSNIITIVAQNTAQSLNINEVNFDESFSENTTSITVTASVGGGAGDPTVTIRHRQLLAPAWSEFKEMTAASNTSFEFEITASMLDDIGVEFEIYANDGITFVENLNNVIKRTFSETNSEELPDLMLGQWQIISIPYELDDNLVTSIFNELGDLRYKKQWRLMHYIDGSYQDQGVGFTRIELGKGYWFNATTDVTVSVGAGQTNGAIPFELSLDQGWNQIGNPYNVPLNWRTIKNENNVSIIVDDMIVFNPDTRTFESNNILAPFSGGFVWSDQAVQLSIDPQTSSTARTAEVATERFVDGDWKLDLTLAWAGEQTNVASLGFHASAKASKDHLDQLTIPRFEQYLEMHTLHGDYFYPFFSKDIRPHSETEVWDFELNSNVLGGPIELQWQLPKTGGYLWLLDQETGKVVDMSTVSSYQLHFDETRAISVHYSTDPAYVPIPSRSFVGDVYPNPAASVCYVPLLLSENTDVKIELIDIQGRAVNSIPVASLEAGVHQFEIDARKLEINEGMYFVRVTFGKGEVMQRKILISK